MRVLLHDHLDGGLRPATAFGLAVQAGVSLPPGVQTAHQLAQWLDVRHGVPLPEAFERFAIPIAVMRTEHSLRQVALEAAEDLAAEGVRYAELRFAPFQHAHSALSADAVVAAVLEGLSDIARPLTARVVLCAMRTEQRTDELVSLALRWLGQGVVGVDLAGPEPGFAAHPHSEAFRRASDAGLGVTIHAGEMDGVASIASAFHDCGAHRIGHGWRLIEDCSVEAGSIVEMGPTARAIHGAGTPLEVCLTSNSCLGVDPREHPFLMLLRAGFVVTLNTDNRTITRCTPQGEERLAADCGATTAEIEQMQEHATRAAFDAPAVATALAVPS